MNSHDEQKGEGVVGQHHARHGGKERRIERQHPSGRGLVPPVAEREQARAGRAEIDDRQEEGRERIETKVRAEPGNAERQRDGFRRGRRQKMRERRNQRSRRSDQARTVDET